MALTQIPSGMIAPAQTLSVNGITFPATQVPSADANTLDDYEEGTWTPTLNGSSSNPTVTYSQQQGRYTKIGRVVYVELYLRLTAYSGGSGYPRIGGLPFTGTSSPYGGFSNIENTGLTTSGTYYSIATEVAGTNADFLKQAPNAATTTLTFGEIGSATTVYFIMAGSYTT